MKNNRRYTDQTNTRNQVDRAARNLLIFVFIALLAGIVLVSYKLYTM